MKILEELKHYPCPLVKTSEGYVGADSRDLEVYQDIVMGDTRVKRRLEYMEESNPSLSTLEGTYDNIRYDIRKMRHNYMRRKLSN